MRDPGMFGGNEGALFGVSGCINFMGEYFPVLAHEYGVHLSARVYLHAHALHAILCGKHQVDVECDLAIRCAFH